LFYAVTVEVKDKEYDLDLKANGDVIKNVEVLETEKD